MSEAARRESTVVEAKVAKKRVQPANSLQAKCSVSRAMTGSELVAVPDFPLLHEGWSYNAKSHHAGARPERPVIAFAGAMV